MWKTVWLVRDKTRSEQTERQREGQRQRNKVAGGGGGGERETDRVRKRERDTHTHTHARARTHARTHTQKESDRERERESEGRREGEREKTNMSGTYYASKCTRRCMEWNITPKVSPRLPSVSSNHTSHSIKQGHPQDNQTTFSLTKREYKIKSPSMSWFGNFYCKSLLILGLFQGLPGRLDWFLQNTIWL